MSSIEELNEQADRLNESLNTLLNTASQLARLVDRPDARANEIHEEIQHISQSDFREVNNGNRREENVQVEEGSNSSFGSANTEIYVVPDEGATAAVVPIIILDDSIANNEVEFVQEFSNQNPVTIDLCVTIDDHSYSTRQENAISPSAIHTTRERRRERNRNRRLTPDHSYADPTPAVEIIEIASPTVSTNSNAVTSLNSTNDNSVSELSSLTKCPICYESYLKRNPMSTICGHIFCKNCITTCLNTTKTCPMCRRKLDKKSIHVLHF